MPRTCRGLRSTLGLLAAGALLGLLPAACTSSTPVGSSVTSAPSTTLSPTSPAAADFDTAFLRAHRAGIKDLAERADAVFVGVVTAVGPAPSSWSGLVPTHQQVTYRVDSTLKGRLAGSSVEVGHAVVQGSQTAGTNGPGLSGSRFAVGSKHLVIVTVPASGPALDEDADLGTIPFSTANEAALRALL